MVIDFYRIPCFVTGLQIVPRDDGDRLRFAGEIDPAYAAAFASAHRAGVEALAYVCRLTTDGIEAYRSVPVDVPEG